MHKFIKMFVVLLAIMFTSLIATSVKADESFVSAEDIVKLSSEEELKVFETNMDNMSVEELQNIITYAKIMKEDKSANPNLALKAAWLAAAQVAKVSGYPLAGTLVTNSVNGNNYYEYNGQFANVIKKTRWMNIMKKNRSGSGEFTRSDSSDLFFAIHLFSYSSFGSSQGTGYTINDIFDFKLDDSYRNLFVSLVNNGAWLSQNVGVLTPIKVTINIV